MNARYQVWARQNPEKLRVKHQRRRCRERGAPGDFTEAEWLDLVAKHDYRCAYCGIAARLTVDHRVPLFWGGSNYIQNILPACIRCNKRKAYRTEDEFRAEFAAEGGLRTDLVLSTRTARMERRGAVQRTAGGRA